MRGTQIFVTGTFDGKHMMVMHPPFRRAHGKLLEMEDTGDTVRMKCQVAT